MDGAGESNNNKVFRRGLENEDGSFTSARASLRARRDRLARREALQMKENSVASPSTSTDIPHDVPEVTIRPVTTDTRSPRTSVTRRSRLANEYSQPVIESNDDETALSLLTSSNILSMDDSSIRPTRGLSGSGVPLRASQQYDTTAATAAADITSPTTAVEGESGAMNSMRKSLPANMRSRRTRKDLQVEDMRTRTPSRELIVNDINGFTETSASQPVQMVNGTTPTTLTNGTSSQHMIRRRRSFLDESTSAAPLISVVNSDVGRPRSISGDADADKPSVERTTSGSTTMSAGAVTGETREERIARYKEMRKAALAARTTQYIDSSADETTAAGGGGTGSGYVSKYRRNRDNSGASIDRNRDDETGSGYVPRWRRYNRDENDIASSSNASSMTDLHVTRKDSSASSDSTDNGPCKLTYENLKLHDKLSSASPPYSSLSRLEENPTIAPIPTNDVNHKAQANVGLDTTDHNKYSNRRESTNDDTPTNSPALHVRAHSRINNRNSTHESFSFDNTVDSIFERPTKKSTESKAINNHTESQAKSRDRPARRTAKEVGNKEFTTSSKGESIHRPTETKALTTQADQMESKKAAAVNGTVNGGLETSSTLTASQTSTAPPAPPSAPGSVSGSMSGSASTSTPAANLSSYKNESNIDPQLAALLDARKAKSGSAAKDHSSNKEVADVTSILKARMKSSAADGNKSSISVSARASFFAEEQKRVSQTASATSSPKPSRREIRTKQTTSVKVKTVKKRRRSNSLPITELELFAAREVCGDRKSKKVETDPGPVDCRPFRGRRLSMAITMTEIREVKNNSPPQKYVRPKEPLPKQEKKANTEKKVVKTGRPINTKNVAAKVDSGRFSRNSLGRTSMRTPKTSKTELTDPKATPSSSIRGSASSLVESNNQQADSPKKFTRRSSSIRVTGSSANSMKAVAARAKAKVDSRRLSSQTTQMNGNATSQCSSPDKVESRRASTTNSDDLPRYMRSTASAHNKDRHTPARTEPEAEPTTHPKRKAVSTTNSEEIPSYMRSTASAYYKDRNTPAPSEPEAETVAPAKHRSLSTTNSDEVPHYMRSTTSAHYKDRNTPAASETEVETVAPTKHRSISTTNSDEIPHYMRLTAAAHYKDIHTPAPSEPEIEHTTPSKHRSSSICSFELGKEPSYMKGTASSAKRLEKEVEEEKPAPPRKLISPTLPDGDLPSFMKATTSYYKKDDLSVPFAEDKVEHLFRDEEEEEEKPPVKTEPKREKKTSSADKKRFSLGGKGSTSVDSIASAGGGSSTARKSRTGDQSSTPSYMKPTTSSSTRTQPAGSSSSAKTLTIPDSLADGAQAEMSTATLSTPSLSGSDRRTPTISVTQVSVDGEEHNVPMRSRKSLSRQNNRDSIDGNSNVTSRTSIANSPPVRSASVRVRGTKAQSVLASLQANGEEGWKRRVGEKDHGSFRAGSIHDRLSKIEDNSKNWQRMKGQANDAKQFTVEGKMAKKGEVTISPSPLMPRKERTLGAAKRAGSFKLKREEGKITPGKSTRPLSMQVPRRESKTPSSQTSTTSSVVTVVQVPDMDDAAEFFASSSTQENIDVTSADFDDIFIQSANLLPSISKIKPKRKQASNSPNPYKALQMRQDLKTEYTETSSNIAELEMKRVKKATVAEKATRSALAGLATKEDINKVALKKASQSQVMTPGGVSAVPYKDLMLIQIKGRRHVETRIVNPCAKSINSGDCFLLVTRNKVFQWMGEFANLMERSKAADLATYIVAKKDLGCTMAKSVIIIEETKAGSRQMSEFWELLGGHASYPGCGPVEEDELYEDYIAETNTVYNVEKDELIPIVEFSGQIPRYDMLRDDQVLVFDFGTEVYAWCGKLAGMDQRKTGLKLAKLLFQSGYNYADYDINPMSPLTALEKGGLPKKSNKRPDWALCGKVTAKMETLLFKEKFFDWPESSRLIQTKEVQNVRNSSPVEELKPFDVNSMLTRSDNPVSLVLEQTNLGRGDCWTEYEDGLKRQYTIETLGLRMWHVSASDYYELTDDSFGQLHAANTYVVRWQYQICQSGVKTLKGNLSKHQVQMGRHRCAYFFWQGAQSTINEKGASALMTVELDEEHGPQVRVEQGLEPACFLSLFKGHMITHLGKREDDEKKNSTKLFVLQHEHNTESSLHEVPCCMESLRSRGVFVYINIRTAILYLWFGSHSPVNMKANGRNLAKWISEHCPLEIGLSLESTVKIEEIREGSEPKKFLTGLGYTSNRSQYDCLMNAPPATQDYVPRLFHMSSVNLVFHVQEIFSPARNESHSSFPFQQCQLYKQQQPAINMLDFGDDVFLWHGWWPVNEESTDNRGSSHSRYVADRKLALETAINYCKAREGATPNMYCVYAGKEPVQFTNRFPEWEVVAAAVTASSLENHSSTLEDMELCFQRLSKSTYTFKELQERPLPDGVNPNKLETYLSDEEFTQVLGMSRDEFQQLPDWKKNNIRKQTNLF